MVPLLSTHLCNSSCMYGGALTHRMLCAGYLDGRADACQVWLVVEGGTGDLLVVEGGGRRLEAAWSPGECTWVGEARPPRDFIL